MHDTSKRSTRKKKLPPLRVAMDTPVGLSEVTLLAAARKAVDPTCGIIAITNDIRSNEGQRLLMRSGALLERTLSVETGGCPRTAVREDASINLRAIDSRLEKFPDAGIVFIDSGGDNLDAMAPNTRHIREGKPFVMCSPKIGAGLNQIVAHLKKEGLLAEWVAG